jgi:hypothetical protein
MYQQSLFFCFPFIFLCAQVTIENMKIQFRLEDAFLFQKKKKKITYIERICFLKLCSDDLENLRQN